MADATDAWLERARKFFISSWDNPLGFIMREYRFMSYLGLRMPTLWHNHPVKYILYSIYRLFILSAVIIFTVTMSIDLYFVRNDFSKMADNLCLVAGFWMVVTKILAFIYIQKDLHEILKILQTLCITDDISKYTLIRDKYILFEIFVVCNFRTTCNLLFLGFVITKSPEDPTPLRAWFPFEVNYTPMQQIMYVYQTIGLFCGINLVHMTETINTVVWHQVAMQFKVLSHQFLDMEEYCLQRVGENGNLDDVYDKRLNVLIMRHQYLIKLSDKLNSVYDYQSSLQVFYSNLMTCLSALGLTLSMGHQKEFFTFLVFLVISVTQLLTWCSYGQILINNSSEIGDVASKSLWYERKTAFIKKTMLVILSSQRPIYMKAGLFVFSYETFVDVLKNSYSCFTLLNSINEE